MANNCEARIVVENRTGETVYGVEVVHKFGNDAAQTFVWMGETPDGQVAQLDAGQAIAVAKYRTGFGAMTDWDWWRVSYHLEASQQFACTSEGLVRAVVACVGGPTSIAGGSVSGLLTYLALNDPSLKSYQAGCSLVATTIGAAVGWMGSGSEKDQMREFMLRGDDAGQEVRIILYANEVKFEAPSGTDTFPVSKTAAIDVAVP